MNNHNDRLKDALRKQHSEVFDYDVGEIISKFKKEISCPVCDTAENTVKFTKDLFNFVKCSNCGMVYLNPRLSDKATYSFYNSEWNDIYNEKKFDVNESTIDTIENRRDLENLSTLKKYSGAGNELLEIGIGKGFFLSSAENEGFKVTGVELNKENCMKAKDVLSSSSTIINSDIYEANLKSNFYDCVYMKDVFEHVPDPLIMLREINRVSKKGGVIFIEVPNIEGLVFKITKQKHSTIFGFEHLNYWSPKTLTEILNRAGYKVVGVQHHSDDFTIGYILQYLFFESHTSLISPKLNKLSRFVIRAVIYLFNKTPFKIVNKISNAFADLLSLGSNIKIIALKDKDI